MVKAQAKPPERLCKLPVFRPVAVRVLAELGKEEADVGEVCRLLGSDPAFSAEVLTLANSALYARAKRVDTVHRAVMTLGLERTRSMAATVALHGMVSGIAGKAAVQNCWHHSRATAIAGECLAPFYGIHPEQAYTAGLMHDIGRLGMLSAYPEYPAILEMGSGSNLDLMEAERESFSVSHCEAGFWLTRIWSLPEEFGEFASHHHTPVEGKAGDRVDLVRVACLLAQSQGFKAAPLIDCEDADTLVKAIPETLRSRSRFSLEGLQCRLQKELDGEAAM